MLFSPNDEIFTFGSAGLGHARCIELKNLLVRGIAQKPPQFAENVYQAKSLGGGCSTSPSRGLGSRRTEP